MKNTVLGFLLLVALGITSCHKAAEVDAERDAKDDPLKEHTQDLPQAQTWLPGTWKLIKVAAMIPNPPVPDVELVIDEKQIGVIQDGVQTDRVDYEIVKTDSGLLIKTNAQPRADNWYVRNPALYLNAKRMYLDLGSATDGPAFDFKKLD